MTCFPGCWESRTKKERPAGFLIIITYLIKYLLPTYIERLLKFSKIEHMIFLFLTVLVKQIIKLWMKYGTKARYFYINRNLKILYFHYLKAQVSTVDLLVSASIHLFTL